MLPDQAGKIRVIPERPAHSGEGDRRHNGARPGQPPVANGANGEQRASLVTDPAKLIEDFRG
jgi:hypothetical protein